MQTILILGGTRDALQIATYCMTLCRSFNRNDMLSVIYSVAGLGRAPSLECEINVGGFGGRQGLQQYLIRHRVSLLIDATHPYATNMKSNAVYASDRAKIPLFRYLRSAWQQNKQDCWQQFTTTDELLRSISKYRRPLFTIGRSALNLLIYKTQPSLNQQYWTIRSIHTADDKLIDIGSDVKLINAIGPFCLDNELQLLNKHKIDVLICKNSGGDGVSAKITAAAQLGLPVLMLKRPELAEIPLQFEKMSVVESTLNSFIKNFQVNSDLIE